MSEKPYVPTYRTTETIVQLVAEISEQVGPAAAKIRETVNSQSRKDNQLRTIHSSLAIGNDFLSLTQVAAVLNGKRILGAPRESREAKNAFEVYGELPKFDPFEMRDLLEAHKILMRDLTDQPGEFRSVGVGIFAGGELMHMAPPPYLVPQLTRDLFDWLKNADVHPLIKSCVFHYEFEFLHPFARGNGRMGRMWHTLLLGHWRSMFQWLPMETLIYEKQDEYFAVLASADQASDPAVFIEFMLRVIRDTLQELIQTVQVSKQVTEQVAQLMQVIGNETLTTKEMISRLGLRTRGTFNSNYLHPALKLGLVEMTEPDKPTTNRQKYRAVEKTDKVEMS